MSDALTPEAPEADAAVETPAPVEAADSGSVDSTEVIPKERFNGLMSRYNADKSAWEQEREAMRAELERLESQAGSEPDEVADQAVLDELREMRAELAREKLDKARLAAVDKYPGAKPLADLILGDTPEAIEGMARELHERLQGLSAGTSADADGDENGTTDPPAADGAPAAPIVGGAVTIPGDGDTTVSEKMTEAIANKDFSAYLRAAEARASEALQGAELTVG